MDSYSDQLFIPGKIGLKWGLQWRRNIIMLGSEDDPGTPILPTLERIYKVSDLKDINNNTTKLSDNVYFIPNLIEWDIKEQKLLCHYINNHGNKAIFIGYVPDISSKFSITDWLLHKFWICCGSTNISNIACGWEKETYDEQESSTYISPNLIQYIKDLMIHLRIHRLLVQGNGGGIHTGTLKDMILLSQCIAQDIGGRDYTVPSDVKQGLLWYAPWHLKLLQESQWDQDASLLYGSIPKYVQQFHAAVAGVRTGPAGTERLIINDILSKVVPPV